MLRLLYKFFQIILLKVRYCTCRQLQIVIVFACARTHTINEGGGGIGERGTIYKITLIHQQLIDSFINNFKSFK